MDASTKRRVTISCFWASTRISVLDSVERYEDSYAITQEFKEWITGLDESTDYLDKSVAIVPRPEEIFFSEEKDDADEMLPT